MKDVLTAIGYLPERKVKQSSVYNRLQTVRYRTTRNRLATSIAFVSAILFLACGYKANIEIYNLIGAEVLSIESLRPFWNFVIIPIGLLAILSQLGGITVMMGAGLFATNRVNLGKLLAMVGTGTGSVYNSS